MLTPVSVSSCVGSVESESGTNRDRLHGSLNYLTPAEFGSSVGLLEGTSLATVN